MIVEFNIDHLVANKLTFEEYFLLSCVKHSNKEQLLLYVKNVKPFETELISNLAEKNFLTYVQDGEGIINFSSLKLKEKALELFPDTKGFEVCFSELREAYPKSFGERKLHLDLTRCKDIYKKTILRGSSVDVAKHQLILKCTKLYVDGLTRTGKMNFIQALPSYLHQKNWEAYIEDVSNGVDNSSDNFNTHVI